MGTFRWKALAVKFGAWDFVAKVNDDERPAAEPKGNLRGKKRNVQRRALSR